MPSMKPYPLELRPRIVEAVDQHLGTSEESARLCTVHTSSVYPLLRHRRARPALAPLPHGGGASATRAAAERRVLAEGVAAQPEAPLAALRQGIEQEKRVRGRLRPLGRWLEELARTRKRSPGGPGKRTRSRGRRLPSKSPRGPRRAWSL